MIKSEVMNKEIELGSETLDDAEIQKILQRGVKTRTESIAQYRAGGREDTAAAEEAEIKVIERYLPKQIGGAELDAAIQELIKEHAFEGKKDMARLMKELKKRHGAAIDGKSASAAAAKALS